MSTTSDCIGGVPFSFFCSLLREIAKAPSHKPSSGHSYRTPNYPALKIFRRWTNKLRSDFTLPPGTTAIIFKLLFPNEDHPRRFDMQETRLSHNIAEAFGVNKNHLDQWMSENASGCLGEELKLVLERTSTTVGGHISHLSIAQVDELLDELASTSGYTHDSIRKKYPQVKRRARLPIIKDLFRTLSPIDAGFLTQIILRDLRPILYPLRETHYIASLMGHNSTSVKMLTKEDAMSIWDPSKWMLNAYRVKATFNETAQGFETPLGERDRNVPKFGIPVAIPKSEKGRGPRQALTFFRNTQQVWAETKYDGERAQIHVQVQAGCTKIAIFSKSKRDSTWDRMAIHDVVYRALGLSRYGSDAHSRVQYNVILDAEMVPFDGEKIAEFHTIKALIEDTAIGIRKRKHIQVESQADSEACSQSSMQTDHSGKLGLVFFDILSLESKSLLMTPYHKRREILEGLIQVLPGECILGERFPIGVRGVSYSVESQIVALDRVFAESIATHEEGLVLKGDDSKYHDFYTPWVKLKRDYIPGHGDTVDMVIVGVTWERERARVLRVPPSTITTFYIGGVKNSEEIRRQPSIRPHLEVYFTVSYGLSRSQLKEINFHIRNSETIPYKPTMKLESDALEYTFSLYPGLAPPKFILKEPLLAELYGAGFTKSPKCDHYELRFPRVTKIHRPADRPWTDGKNLIELHKLACEVVGRDSAAKEAKNATAEMWGITASPGAKSTQKMNATRRVWLGKLAALDGRDRMSDRESRSPSPPSSPMPAAKRPRTGRVKKNDEVKAISRLRTPQAGSSNIQTIASTHNDLVDSLVPSNSPRSQGSVDALESQSSQFGKSSAQPLGTMTNICPAPSSGPRSQRSTFGLPCSPSSTPPRPPRPRLKALLPETIPPVNAFTTTALALPFPENALVWFAKPRGESWAVKSTVPRGQRTHSVEALLAGCGWYADTRGTPWAEKGIVLVDDESVAGKEMARQVLKTMDERSKELPGDQARKTIWIFDRTTWALVEEVESNALHKFE